MWDLTKLWMRIDSAAKVCGNVKLNCNLYLELPKGVEEGTLCAEKQHRPCALVFKETISALWEGMRQVEKQRNQQ